MKRIALNNWIRITQSIGGFLYNKELIDEILDPKIDLEENFLNPLIHEFEDNLLEIETISGKEALIRLYISKIYPLDQDFDFYDYLFYDVYTVGEGENMRAYNCRDSAEIAISRKEIYVLSLCHLFNMFIGKIIEYCYIFHIDHANIYDDVVRQKTAFIVDSFNQMGDFYKNFKTEPAAKYTSSQKYNHFKNPFFMNKRKQGSNNCFPERTKKTFSEFLPGNKIKQENLAQICIDLFDKNHSPKDYAIMFCILSQDEKIDIPNKRRSEIFRAWYDFIDRPHPKNEKYTAINKYIGEKSAAGFEFSDIMDGDFRTLQDRYQKEINKSKNKE